jgi:hypothetical protein
MSWRIHRYLGACVAVVTGLVVSVGGAPAAAADTRIAVDLGVHQFGHPSTAEAVVVRAGPDQVGFSQNPGEDIFGPWSFQVMPDGTVWMLDEVNNRLLAWAPGHRDQPTASVPVGPPGVWDFVVAPDGNIFYLTTLGGPALHAITAKGQVRWTAPVAGAGQLRIGPNGAVYLVDPAEGAWIPVTTVDGRALPIADQTRLTKRHQPLPGGGSLAVTWTIGDRHHLDIALLDAAGRTTRAWRITSATEIEGAGSSVPALVDGDPVIFVGVYVFGTADTPTRVERLALRLTATGARPPVVLARHTYGDTTTDLRVGPDGKLYQLTTDPDTGATLTRFALPGRAPTSPSPTASSAAPGTPTAVTPTDATASPPAAVAPNRPAHPTGTARWLLISGAGLLVLIGSAATVMFLRRRHEPSPQR